MNKLLLYIIEDDPWQAEQYQRVLLGAGYDAVCFTSGVTAIQAIDETPPAAIVLDLLLAGTTGVTLLHELQSYDDTGKMPVILCTNLADQIRLTDLAPYGVRRILDKTTMQPHDLVTAVRSCLL